MYKIGYIDDVPEQFENYRRKLRRSEIELILFETSKEKKHYIDQIYYHQAEALLIDYKMVGTLGFQGSTLINYINDTIADISCFILTAVETDQITDKLVTDRQIYSKEVFDTEADDRERVAAYEAFVQNLKNSAEVFESRRKLKCDEYLALYRKKQTGSLSITEEEEFRRLYRILSSYGMVEKLPDLFLQSDFEKKLDRLLAVNDVLLQKKGIEG